MLTKQNTQGGSKLMEIKKETQLTTTENTEIVITNDNGLIKLENFADIKSRLTEALNKYTVEKVDNDNIADAKAQRAELNKLEKAFAGKRKDEQKRILAPFVEAEAQIKELEKIIKDLSMKIDNNIKAYESDERGVKYNEILAYYLTFNSPIALNTIWNEKWLNKTYKLYDIKTEIVGFIEASTRDLEYIETSVGNDDPALKMLVRETYIKHPDLIPAIDKAKAELAEQRLQIELAEKSGEVKDITITIRCNEPQWKALITYAQSLGIQIKKEV